MVDFIAVTVRFAEMVFCSLTGMGPTDCYAYHHRDCLSRTTHLEGCLRGDGLFERSCPIYIYDRLDEPWRWRWRLRRHPFLSRPDLYVPFPRSSDV